MLAIWHGVLTLVILIVITVVGDIASEEVRGRLDLLPYALVCGVACASWAA